MDELPEDVLPAGMDYSASEMEAICNDWIRILTLAMDWPHDKARDWARNQIQSAKDDPFFSHETVSWYLLPLIITDEISTQTKSMGDLRSSLDLTLESFREKMWGEISAEEIDRVRAEIRRIIDRYTA
ncbi:MAG TPA: hypothetical protein VK797_18390 [Tepidisphaeraceae bacterium]|jgi:hypothetical protein|nr:hypothetical protein [Tepidisphaeraceae bacterium]